MRIVRRDQFVTSAWKNGGGVTHEIARHEDGGQLLWRLSLAEVDRDGPFSAFAGLTRILTVIDGPGMRLEPPGGPALIAAPLQPVRFSGDLPIFGRLAGGPCRDVNLIFDADRIAGDVTVLRGGARGLGDGVLVLAGRVSVGGDVLPAGDYARTDGAEVACGSDGLALLLRMASV